ncbi:hypothetical protein A5893_08210 [Pedobacter psychrophilus]|uniref:DUF3037 domain-containing protein n=1 Tax=Pedobacter psychrophilus TaxID=1826909 RepID=A0A179DF17_9SPHI|nr:DUF3037 domain-containing protein [Pedobacter psychrophilus]OAQ39568.1 hypothetical protein A5893_08210 [Pedobacter psychrophilus]
MLERNLFEYAVLRVVPRVEREEFLNVGVVLFCKKEKFLKVKYQLNDARLKGIYPDLDLKELEQHLHVFKCICEGIKCGSQISDLDIPSRFRWLTATRSTIIQTSKPHPGFSKNLESSLEKLFEEFVL